MINYLLNYVLQINNDTTKHFEVIKFFGMFLFFLMAVKAKINLFLNHVDFFDPFISDIFIVNNVLK